VLESVPWLFFTVSLIGAWFTLNAYLPHRRTGPLIVPSFFAGWLTSELAAHHLGWQIVASVVFVAAGALDAWPGWWGLGITLVSWLGLVALVPQSKRAEPVVEEALPRALGQDYRDAILPEVMSKMEKPHPRGRLVAPFLLYDREV
jgi:hypothetical protein